MFVPQLFPFTETGVLHVWVVAPVEVHAPALWHASIAGQVTAAPAVHAPPWQVSVCVQPLPSLQAVLFAAAGFEHAPVLVVHVPAAWHWSLAVQVTGFDPVQTPPWHE